MDDTDRRLRQLGEDVAVIKQRLCAADTIQRDRMVAIATQLDRLDSKLDTVTSRIDQLEAQNKTLKWITGIVLSAAAAFAAWSTGGR